MIRLRFIKRQFLSFCLICLQLFSNSAFSKGTESSGGGGGFVHDTFIFAGYRVLYFLRAYPEGQKIVKELGLNICRLKNTLRENLVYVINDDQGLQDQRRSTVDAFSYPWRIYLNNSSWKEKFDSINKSDKDDFYHLVFKEMLRSEGQRFSTAITDSMRLKPFPKNLYLDRELNLDSMLTLDESCLNEKDKKTISDIENTNTLFINKELPHCTSEDIGSDFSTIDRLLSIARRAKCEIKTSKCGIDIEKMDSGNSIIYLKSIFWKSQRLYSVPFSVVEKISGEQENISSGSYEQVLDNYLQELEFYKVCEPTGRNWAPKVPKVSVLKDFLSVMGISFTQSLEFLRQKPGQLDGAFLLGMGSKVELISDEISLEKSMKAAFVKVRVVSNTISDIEKDGKILFSNGLAPFFPNRPLAKPMARVGDEGYVLLSLTEWLNYLYPETNQLLSK